MDDIISINDVKIIMDSDEEWENISINDTKDVTNSEIEVTKSEIDLTNDEIYLTKGEIEFTKGDISYMKMDTNDNIVVYTLLRIAKKNIEEDKIEDDPTNEMIIKCLENSNLSYDDNIRHKEFNNSKFNNVRLYIERKEDKMIISIRGTVTMYDIVNDIDCFQEKMDEEELIKENLLVHNGFYKDFKEIKKYLKELIKKEIIEKKRKQIYFTGHSRGSAISTFSSLYIKTVFPELEVYNIGFGCPRVGNKEFVDYYNKNMRDNTYLFRTEFDIVPKVPIYNYYDIMNQYVIKDNKVFIYEETDNIVDLIHSGLEFHKIIYYNSCNYCLPISKKISQ
jgi:predicted lipase